MTDLSVKAIGHLYVVLFEIVNFVNIVLILKKTIDFSENSATICFVVGTQAH